MPNPALNEKVFQASVVPTETEAGWAAPGAETGTYHAPSTDGPATPYRSVRTGVMTVGGTAAATGVLLVLLLAAAVVGWNLVSVDATSQDVNFPGWLLLPLFAALGVAFLTAFKPHLARFTSPVYALLEGLVVGAISHVFDAQWDGIVLQAVGATVGVVLLYGVSLLFSLFGSTPSFLYDSSLLGIGLSVLVAGIAAFNLALDFDMIEKGSNMGAPKYMEWYGAFGLLVTLVWLYLELLRLLARLRSR